MQQGRKDFKKLLSDFKPDDIFNFDEAALFWQMLPDRSVMLKHGEKGVKRVKYRVSIGLMCNMSGTGKRAPIVIGKAKRPRCWSKKDMKYLPVRYYNSKKGWMTGKIFEKILLDFNRDMKNQDRHVVLIVDGAGN